MSSVLIPAPFLLMGSEGEVRKPIYPPKLKGKCADRWVKEGIALTYVRQ